MTAINPPHQTQSRLPAARLQMAGGGGGETWSPPLAVHIKPNNFFFHPPQKKRQAAFVQVAHAFAQVCFKQGHAISLSLCGCLCSFLLMQESGYVLEHTRSAQSDHCQLHYSSISAGRLGPKAERRKKIKINTNLSLCKLPGKRSIEGNS